MKRYGTFDLFALIYWFFFSAEKIETIPEPAPGVDGSLGQWMSPEKLNEAIKERFPGCMKGRTMYLVPYSMGPIGGKLSKNGIELTDSAYVAVSMRVMTRVDSLVLGKGTRIFGWPTNVS